MQESAFLCEFLYDFFFSNMVLALKELSIRGDFRTTVEYLIGLLETDDFVDNEFDTQWLDGMIAGRTSNAEKPSTLLGVVCASVLVAQMTIVNAFQNFQNCLDRYAELIFAVNNP